MPFGQGPPGAGPLATLSRGPAQSGLRRQAGKIPGTISRAI